MYAGLLFGTVCDHNYLGCLTRAGSHCRHICGTSGTAFAAVQHNTQLGSTKMKPISQEIHCILQISKGSMCFMTVFPCALTYFNQTCCLEVAKYYGNSIVIKMWTAGGLFQTLQCLSQLISLKTYLRATFLGLFKYSMTIKLLRSFSAFQVEDWPWNQILFWYTSEFCKNEKQEFTRSFKTYLKYHETVDKHSRVWRCTMMP